MFRSLLGSCRSYLAFQLFVLVFPASVFAGIELPVIGSFGVMSRLGYPLKHPEPKAVLFDAPSSGFVPEANSSVVSINFSVGEESPHPVRLNLKEFDSRNHTLIFFLAGSNQRKEAENSALLLIGESVAITATPRGKCRSVSSEADAFGCIHRKQDSVMIVQVDSTDEDWLAGVYLKLGDSIHSLCDLLSADLDAAFGLFVLAGEDAGQAVAEFACPGKQQWSTAAAIQDNGLTFVRGEWGAGHEMPAGYQLFNQLLAFIHSPRQLPPPEEEKQKKDSEKKQDQSTSSPTSDSSTDRGLSEIRVTNGDKGEKGDGEGNDPWKKEAAKATADWKSIKQLMDEQREAQEQLQEINEQLLALLTNTEMDPEEKEQERQRLQAEKERLQKKIKDIYDKLALMTGERSSSELRHLGILVRTNRQFQKFSDGYFEAVKSAENEGLYRPPTPVSRQVSRSSFGSLSRVESQRSLSSHNGIGLSPSVLRQNRGGSLRLSSLGRVPTQKGASLMVSQPASMEDVGDLTTMCDLLATASSHSLNDQRVKMPPPSTPSVPDSVRSGLSAQSSVNSKPDSRISRVKKSKKPGSRRVSIIDGSLFNDPADDVSKEAPQTE